MRAIDRLLRNRPKAGGLSLLGKIRALFANGEQGWWYDPSNFSTLYQDSAGTTPVTAVEQPVGLQLDLSKGLVLGPELFSTFTSTGTWTVSGNTYSITSAAGQTDLRVDYTGTVGKRYVLSFTATGVSGSVFCFPLNTTPFSYVNGTNTIRESSNAGFFIIRVTTGASSTITNISVKELPGNHRFQTTSANRPVVSARVNLLTKTEEFSNAYWDKSAMTLESSTVTAPDGTATATRFSNTAATSTHRLASTAFTSGLNTLTLWAKAGTASFISINRAVTDFQAVFNLSNGTVSSNAGCTATITPDGNGFYKLTLTSPTVASQFFCVNFATTATNAAAGASFLGAGETMIIWHPDARSATQGVDLPAYQRVNTSTDYDSTGFPVYIKPNGSNQFMQTNSINFTATDKMTVWQGVRKLSSSTFQIITETGTDSYSVAGSFGIFPTGPVTRTESYGTFLRGSNVGLAGFGPYVAPITNVLQLSYDIGASTITGEIVARINGAAVGYEITGGSAGTGNFGNLPAYFYARAGSKFFFNGNDYGSIARGAASTAAQITAGETYINSKTKAY